MEEQNLNNVGDTNQSPPSDNTTQTIPQSIENSSNFASAQVKYAGFWIRYAAFFIDMVILYVISIPIIMLTIALTNEIGSPFFYYFLELSIIWGYHILMTDKYQATLGKRFVGIKVVKEDLGKASLGNLILRESAGKILSLVTLLAGYVMAAFTLRKRALHDIIGGTVVIFDDKNPKSRKLIIGVTIASVIFSILYALAKIVILIVASRIYNI